MSKAFYHTPVTEELSLLPSETCSDLPKVTQLVVGGFAWC